VNDFMLESWDSSDRMIGVRILARNLSLRHRVQTGSGTYPISYPMGTRDFFPGGNVAGTWSWSHTSI